MIEAFATNELFSCEVEGLLSYPLEIFVSVDDFFQARSEASADLEGILALGFAEFLNHLDDSLEDVASVLLDIGHEVFDFFILGLVDDELIGLFHEVVELLGEF